MGEVIDAPRHGASHIHDRHAGKYLTFDLGDEQFGIEILRVREIIGLMDTTPVPGAPRHIKGVINLRGKIIPVMDLRSRFEMPKVDLHDRNCIIVVEVMKVNSKAEIGLLVDSVSEVLNINSQEIEPSPELSSSVDTAYILGLAKSGPDVKILLDIDRVVTVDQKQFSDISSEQE